MQWNAEIPGDEFETVGAGRHLASFMGSLLLVWPMTETSLLSITLWVNSTWAFPLPLCGPYKQLSEIMRGPHTENYSFFALERRQPLRTFFFFCPRLEYKKKNKWKIPCVFDLERVKILEAQQTYTRIYFFFCIFPPRQLPFTALRGPDARRSKVTTRHAEWHE